MSEKTAQPQSFELQKIYHKAISYEAPDVPAAFLDEWKPSVKIDLNTSADRLSDTTYEVSLTVIATVSPTNAVDKTLFKLTLEQCGLFEIAGYEEQELIALLGSYCPSQLYPYARATISDLIVQGGFPQLLLAPVDFDALLEDAVQRAQAEEEAKAKADAKG